MLELSFTVVVAPPVKCSTEHPCPMCVEILKQREQQKATPSESSGG